MMVAAKIEDFQLLETGLDKELKKLGYSGQDLTVELFANDKQRLLQLYCTKGGNRSYNPS